MVLSPFITDRQTNAQMSILQNKVVDDDGRQTNKRTLETTTTTTKMKTPLHKYNFTISGFC